MVVLAVAFCRGSGPVSHFAFSPYRCTTTHTHKQTNHRTNRENSSSANSKRFIPTPKWTCDGPNSNAPFANMVELVELPFWCPKTQPLLSSKWSPNDKPIWPCNKWRRSIVSIGLAEPGMKPCKKNDRLPKLARWERRRKMRTGISHGSLCMVATIQQWNLQRRRRRLAFNNVEKLPINLPCHRDRRWW